MKSYRFIPVLAYASLCMPTYLWAAEGFHPSHNPNVFQVKSSTSGATAFLVNLPELGQVLMTELHVVQNAGGPGSKLTWGIRYGWFFQPTSQEPGAIEIGFPQYPIWKSEELDIAIFAAPTELAEKCHCSGLEIEAYQDGPVSLLGYPIIGRRTFPQVGKFWTRLGELFGSVEQMESTGIAWRENLDFISDVDALSGNSGGPVMNARGNVIGIIHNMKTWYGDGYRYHSPQIDFIAIDTVLDKITRLKTSSPNQY